MLTSAWYKRHKWVMILLPLSWLYQLLSAGWFYYQKKRAVRLAVPVVIIGNISVGGTGKTPVIIALAKALKDYGLSPGIISRGYGSQAPCYPYTVSVNDHAQHAGDEPLLIAHSTDCPVVIGKNRVSAAQKLIHDHPQVTVLLSDDGLQHYHLARTVEVVVVDGDRGLGNHFCLPAGPLREPASRLASVNWILNNRSEAAVSRSDTTHAEKLLDMVLQPTEWKHLASQKRYPLYPFPWLADSTTAIPPLIAIAGIGNPERFFNTLVSLGVQSAHYAYDDHHIFSAHDVADWQQHIVLMTEKDAVKCQDFIHEQCWSLQVNAVLPQKLVHGIINQINHEKKQR